MAENVNVIFNIFAIILLGLVGSKGKRWLNWAIERLVNASDDQTEAIVRRLDTIEMQLDIHDAQLRSIGETTTHAEVQLRSIEQTTTHTAEIINGGI